MTDIEITADIRTYAEKGVREVLQTAVIGDCLLHDIRELESLALRLQSIIDNEVVRAE